MAKLPRDPPDVRPALPLPGAGVPRIRRQRRLRRPPDGHRPGRRRAVPGRARRRPASTSSATRWAAASASTSRFTNPTASGSWSPSAASAPTSSARGPARASGCCRSSPKDPTRQRLVDWLQLDGLQPGAGHGRTHRGALGTRDRSRRRWSRARRMYGKAAFAQMMSMMRKADMPMPWAQMHKVRCPDAVDVGPRRPGEPARHGAAFRCGRSRTPNCTCSPTAGTGR